MRLTEALCPRLKPVDFSRHQIAVQDGKVAGFRKKSRGSTAKPGDLEQSTGRESRASPDSGPENGKLVLETGSPRLRMGMSRAGEGKLRPLALIEALGKGPWMTTSLAAYTHEDRR